MGNSSKVEHINEEYILSNLQNIRKRLYLTQEEVAEYFSISVKHLSEIERGISRPSFSLFVKILNYYNSKNGQEIDVNKIFYNFDILDKNQ